MQGMMRDPIVRGPVQLYEPGNKRTSLQIALYPDINHRRALKWRNGNQQSAGQLAASTARCTNDIVVPHCHCKTAHECEALISVGGGGGSSADDGDGSGVGGRWVAVAVRRGQCGAAARPATARHIDAIIAGGHRYADHYVNGPTSSVPAGGWAQGGTGSGPELVHFRPVLGRP